MSNKIRCARRVAFADISKYLREVYDEVSPLWVVTPKQIYNAESQLLNDELDVNKVNYIGNKNSRRKGK